MELRGEREHHDGRRVPASSEPIVVCLLGMHRSGTSCLAGCLEEAGLALGDNVITKAPYNRKGNRENPHIMALHQDLLASSGGSWHTPPASVKWTREHRVRRAAIIASYRRFPVWGFKDPRTLLVLDGWREAIPHMQFVGTFRHPHAVAKSLNARDGFSLDRGIELWTSYNRILLHYQAVFGFDMVSFDLTPAAYRDSLSDITFRLGLKPPVRGFTFFEGGLKHQTADSGALLAPEVATIYDSLNRLPTERTTELGPRRPPGAPLRSLQ